MLNQTVKTKEKMEDASSSRSSLQTSQTNSDKEDNYILCDVMKRFGIDNYYPELKTLLTPETFEEAEVPKGKKKGEKQKPVKPPSRSKSPVKKEILDTSREISPEIITSSTEKSVSDQQCLEFVLANLTAPINKL